MGMKRWLVGLALGASFLNLGAAELPDGIYAEFLTPRGDFVVLLHHREVPMTVASFVGLAEGTIAPRDGRPYFTGLKWYRVVPGFVIQSGDPDHEKNAGQEDAAPPFTFPDEFVPGLRHAEAGILSMANAGPDTNNCEFFLTLGDCTRLNYLHSVFGRVVRGGEVLARIEANDPYEIRIRRVGAAAREFKADAATFDAMVARAKRYTASAEPGPAAHFDDPDQLLPAEPPRARTFNYKLANFERTTGVKVVGRVFAAAPTAEEDKVAGATMRNLATRLGIERTGVLAVHFAADRDWRVWFGDELIPHFLGRAVQAGDLDDGGAVHIAKMQLIDEAVARGDAAFAAQKAGAPSERPPAPGQQLKLQTDAVLDALLLRFENVPRR